MRKAARVIFALALAFGVGFWLTTCETRVPVYFEAVS
jgi:hypothetical protein